MVARRNEIRRGPGRASHLDPGRYEEYHEALMIYSGKLSEMGVFGDRGTPGPRCGAPAGGHGGPGKCGVPGTRSAIRGRIGNHRPPSAFVIGNELVPGAVGLERMKTAVRWSCKEDRGRSVTSATSPRRANRHQPDCSEQWFRRGRGRCFAPRSGRVRSRRSPGSASGRGDRRAVSMQIGLNRAGAFRSLGRCAIPSVISTARPR